MRIPIFQTCECTHRGAVHNPDGSCARCGCVAFKRQPAATQTLQPSLGRHTRVMLDRDARAS